MNKSQTPQRSSLDHRHSVSPLPVPTGTPAIEQSSQRVCIVTGEIAGPDFNGGIGTANRGLALALASEGYQIDVLYTRIENRRAFCFRGSFADQVHEFRHLGINLGSIYHLGAWNDWLAKSYRVMEHLTCNKYDLVFFNDCHGTAYYPLLAKKTGDSRLARTIMCVITHGSTQWVAELNEQHLESIADLRMMEIERRSVELADFVISPSAYLLKKYIEYEWTLPIESYVHPNVLPRQVSSELGFDRRLVAINELVFFGRLETRKGLWLFCNALERIKYQLVGQTVTFLGRFTRKDGVSTGLTVMRRAAAWPFRVRFLPNYDQEQALNYLKGGARLAVMPSLADNSPCVILECLNEGIPFIATSGSGGEELLLPECHSDCLFEPKVEALTSKMIGAISLGVRTGVPSFDPEESEQALLRWVNAILAKQAEEPTAEQKEPAGSDVLIVFVPPVLDGQSILQALDELLSKFGDCKLILLCEDVDEIEAALRCGNTNDQYKNVQIVGKDSFARALSAIEAKGMMSVGVFCLGGNISPQVLSRARICFSANEHISAITCHAGREEIIEQEELPPYVSLPSSEITINRYIIGNATSLFTLTQETNDGFAVLRHDVLTVVASRSPFDEKSGRLKPVSHWIHELLLLLVFGGKQFEIIPDIYLDLDTRESEFETNNISHFMHSVIGSNLGFVPNSPQELLARLAIDSNLVGPFFQSALKKLVHLSNRLITDPNEWDVSPTSDEFLRLLSSMAHVNGQIGLGNELLAEVVGGNRNRNSRSAPFLVSATKHAERESNEISLFDLAAEGAFDCYDLSLNLLEEKREKREIEISFDGDNKNFGLIRFPGVDLTDKDQFYWALEVESENAGLVRVRFEFAAHGNSEAVSGSSIVFGIGHEVKVGELREFFVKVPSEQQRLCDILLSVELVDGFSPTDVPLVRLIDPTFGSRRPRDSDSFGDVEIQMDRSSEDLGFSEIRPFLNGMSGEELSSGERLFFIQGLWRSGTSWVGRMIENQPQLYVCHRELQTFMKGFKVTQNEGDLADNPFLQERFLACQKAGFLSILQNLHLEEKPAAHLLGDRSPGGDVNLIKEVFPLARLVIVIRDGRDICVSWAHAEARRTGKTLIIEDENGRYIDHEFLVDMAQRYMSYIPDYLSVNERYPNTVHLILYEELLSNTANVMHAVLTFLGVKTDLDTVKEICRDHTFNAEREHIPDLTKSGLNRMGIAGDWKNHFSETDLSIYEEIAGDALKAVGYELFASQKG